MHDFCQPYRAPATPRNYLVDHTCTAWQSQPDLRRAYNQTKISIETILRDESSRSWLMAFLSPTPLVSRLAQLTHQFEYANMGTFHGDSSIRHHFVENSAYRLMFDTDEWVLCVEHILYGTSEWGLFDTHTHTLDKQHACLHSSAATLENMPRLKIVREPASLRSN